VFYVVGETKFVGAQLRGWMDGWMGGWTDGCLDIQGVPGGKDLTSGECSLGQTIPI
jgi:hypothetical protein